MTDKNDPVTNPGLTMTELTEAFGAVWEMYRQTYGDPMEAPPPNNPNAVRMQRVMNKMRAAGVKCWVDDGYEYSRGYNQDDEF